MHPSIHPFNQPTTEKLVAVAPKIKLEASGEGSEEKQKRLETLPFLLKGHLLELAAACRSGDAKEQLQEMEVGAWGVTILDHFNSPRLSNHASIFASIDPSLDPHSNSHPGGGRVCGRVPHPRLHQVRHQKLPGPPARV